MGRNYIFPKVDIHEKAGYEFRMTRLFSDITNSEMAELRNINVNMGYKFGKPTRIKITI